MSKSPRALAYLVDIWAFLPNQILPANQQQRKRPSKGIYEEVLAQFIDILIIQMALPGAYKESERLFRILNLGNQMMTQLLEYDVENVMPFFQILEVFLLYVFSYYAMKTKFKSHKVSEENVQRIS